MIFDRIFKRNEKCGNDSEFASKAERALQNGEFEVYYQPQYNYNTKKMCGAEALIRWNLPQGEVLFPSEFISKLENTKTMYRLDKYIWKKACEDLKEWKKANMGVEHLSVNISGNDICNADFKDYLLSLIKENSLNPEELHLEITETAYVKDLKLMENLIRTMQQSGFVFEMDDFGSGYSSLKTLKNVPFDIIKLDVEFLRGSENSEKAKNILASVITMLQKIKTPIIVEGVEHKEQAEFLNGLGCRYMQGYYFGKPVKKKDFEQLLKKEKEEMGNFGGI